MTPEERQTLIQDLERSRELLADAVNGLDEPAWRSKQPGKWCIGEVVEHLNLIENAVEQMALPRFLAQPPGPEAHPEKDPAVSAGVRNRSERIEAPDRICPKGNGAAPDQEIAKFRRLRSKTIEYVRTTADDLRHHVGEHPVLGPLDCYQWLLALSAHTERHVLQIQELKTAGTEDGGSSRHQ